MQGVEQFLRFLFCIISRLELEKDISEACAKFERVSFARFKFGNGNSGTFAYQGRVYL